MSDNVTMVQIVNNSHEPSTTLTIIILVLFFLSIVFAIIGNPHKKIRRFIWISGIAFIIFACILLLSYSDSFREFAVSMAAISATIIAIISLWDSQKLRRETRDRENKEQLRWGLETITQWAIQVISHITIAARYAKNGEDVIKMIMDCRAELAIDVAASIRIRAIGNELSISTLLPKETAPQLQRSIELADVSLRNFNQLLFDTNATNLIKNTPIIVDSVYDLTGQLTNLVTMTSNLAFK